MGRDSSVGIATPMNWTVRGSNPEGGGRVFSQPSRPELGPTQPTVQWATDLSLGGVRDKAAEVWL